jgi:hypothetical protein
MQHRNSSPEFPSSVQSALRRQALLAEGRLDAFRFAWECKGDISKLLAKVQETEELIFDPDLLAGSMAPSANPRIYREAYLLGLKDAIEIITNLIT